MTVHDCKHGVENMTRTRTGIQNLKIYTEAKIAINNNRHTHTHFNFSRSACVTQLFSQCSMFVFLYKRLFKEQKCYDKH